MELCTFHTPADWRQDLAVPDNGGLELWRLDLLPLNLGLATAQRRTQSRAALPRLTDRLLIEEELECLWTEVLQDCHSSMPCVFLTAVWGPTGISLCGPGQTRFGVWSIGHWLMIGRALVNGQAHVRSQSLDARGKLQLVLCLHAKFQPWSVFSGRDLQSSHGRVPSPSVCHVDSWTCERKNRENTHGEWRCTVNICRGQDPLTLGYVRRFWSVLKMFLLWYNQ